ncbi:protein FAR1-RELATED SEQUENCE 5-like [Salvia hispanica]|uniref:protein FAR1-RELATED SEQUENCE 5-like n=1 Tax=Salvia hispanica TaxID=49212 RepID=UPI00200918E2|nr:protein FAR1-RELATED SEQUENCE 5-like [Salvia hispanica]
MKEKRQFLVVVSECSKDLKPVFGQKFKSLDFCFAFYDVYARAVGFDTRKAQMRKADGVITWYNVVCNREGSKKSSEDDQANARSGFSIKRRRLSKRCGCKASISFKFFSEGGVSGYTVEEFNEVHNHYMVETEHQQFMSINRKLDDVHHQFILDCSKANIGPTLTFNVLKEILGGFQLVGCNVGDIRNASRDIKAYAHGIDVQMVLDDMAKKKEMSEAFTYEYERNYHMFGDIVAFDTTYNTNRYCMIFAPFTGKDNHGRPVTFAAGLVSSEKTGAFAWLFRHFVQCMGVAPKMIVTDQDLGMGSAIEEILVGTRHRWCMWHIMHKLANKVPGRLLRHEDFKKEFNACIWSDLLEPDEFEEEWNGVVERYGLEEHSWFMSLYEYRKLWIPAYFRDFPLGSMIRTTSISESENSFYKNFLKPRNNIAEFYMNFNQALEFQRNSRTKLDYQDATAYIGHYFGVRETCFHYGYLCSHIFFLFRNNEVKKIPDTYCASRWLKTPLAKVVHGHFDETLPTQSVVDERQNVSKQGISLFYGFLRRFETDIDVLRAFVGGLEELGNSLQAGTPTTSASEKRRMIEQFYGMERPKVVEVHPPDVVKTKGHASSSASRLISKREKAIKEANRPLRRCKACEPS